MDINLSLKPQFEAVFLINGKLSEGGRIVFSNNEVVYITVLPLESMLLPYTIKIVGDKVKSNEDLAFCYNLKDGEFHLKLLPRYSYIYAVGEKKKGKEKTSQGLVQKFFNYVLKRKLSLARDCLSNELSDSIDDENLKAFFDGYDDLVKGENCGEYYLIKKNNKGVLYWFDIVDGVIDNIVEKD